MGLSPLDPRLQANCNDHCNMWVTDGRQKLFFAFDVWRQAVMEWFCLSMRKPVQLFLLLYGMCIHGAHKLCRNQGDTNQDTTDLVSDSLCAACVAMHVNDATTQQE